MRRPIAIAAARDEVTPTGSRPEGDYLQQPGYVALLIVVLSVLLLAGCAPGTETYADDRAGFLSGVWHGWIAPVSILWHFVFDDAVRVYETNNTGIWYDVGFYIAIISGFGSLSLTRRRPRKDS